MSKNEDRISIWSRGNLLMPEKDEFRRLSGLDTIVEEKPGEVILKQLGGFARLDTLLGGTFVYLPHGIEIRWPANPNMKINGIRVTVRPEGTYDVEFFSSDGKSRRIVKKLHGIYGDQLVPTFEKQTGHALRLS